MMIKLQNGDVFDPNSSELFAILFFLKGIFTPGSFEIFDADCSKRSALAKCIEKPSVYMDMLSESKEHPGFDFGNKIEELSFSECAQYMMFCLRLVYRQGGNDALCTMWKNGNIERLVDRMIHLFDNNSIEQLLSPHNR